MKTIQDQTSKSREALTKAINDKAEAEAKAMAEENKAVADAEAEIEGTAAIAQAEAEAAAALAEAEQDQLTNAKNLQTQADAAAHQAELESVAEADKEGHDRAKAITDADLEALISEETHAIAGDPILDLADPE